MILRFEMVQAFVYSAHSSPHDYEDDASGQYMGLASCMKYACFADNFFLLILLSPVVLPITKYGGIRLFHFIVRPLMHLDHLRGCPFIILLIKGVCGAKQSSERRTGISRSHRSSIFVAFLPRLIRTIEVGVFDFGLPSLYLKRIITAYHRNHSCDSYFLLSFSSRDSHLEQKWYCYWSCSASTQSGRNVRIILEM